MPAAEGISRNERMWASLAHLCGGLWVLGIPFGGLIASGVVYVTKRHVSPYVAHHSREAQNFQITVTIAVVALVVLTALVAGRSAAGGDGETALEAIVAGATLLAIVMILNVALSVTAALAADRSEAYRYPVSLRFIREVSPVS